MSLFFFSNLPWNIYISLPIVTFIYTLANVAYFAVIPPALMSDAIAVTFVSPLAILVQTYSFINLNLSIFPPLFFSNLPCPIYTLANVVYLPSNNV
jgi:hypothetical protein